MGLIIALEDSNGEQVSGPDEWAQKRVKYVEFWKPKPGPDAKPWHVHSPRVYFFYEDFLLPTKTISLEALRLWTCCIAEVRRS